MQKERYDYIDTARGIAAYLVVLGHCLDQIAGKSILLITYCHMPVFFWISGFVLQHSLTNMSSRIRGGLWRLIKKKIHRLLIPYLVWSTVAWSVNVFIGAMHEHISISYVLKEFISIFFFARSVWFLVVIFVSEMFCIVVWYLVQRVWLRYAMLISVWFVVCLSPFQELLHIFKFKWLFPFMTLGMLCKEFAIYEKYCNRIYIKILGLLFVPMALLVYRDLPFAEWISCSYSGVKNMGIGGIYYLCSMLSIILVLWISIILSKKRFGRYIAVVGGCSLEIYVMHMLMVKFLPIVPVGIMENNISVYLYFGMYAIFLTVCIVLVAKYYERFRILRWMVGK